MPGRETNDESRTPEPLQAPETPATDSDLNELLTALASRVKAARRENKLLASHNRRLAVVLAQRGAVTLGPQRPTRSMTMSPGAGPRELTSELIRRLDMLDAEGDILRSENDRLTTLARELELPAWRIEETRVGTSRLVPGPRAFIRRRRT